MKFGELTQIALLGTERQEIHAPIPGSALGNLQAKVKYTTAPRTLLSLSALTFLHEAIGALPSQDHGPAPQPSPTERQPLVGLAANSMLLRMLAGEFRESLPDWLKLASQSNRLARPEALPWLLELGRSNANLREPLRPIMGERGRWLASQNEDWSWVGKCPIDDEANWQTGAPTDRLLFLQRLRQSDPARARELLFATWKDETPDDRASLIGALGTGLTPADEDFLETALDDKRKEVRKQAAVLLARLPQSKLVLRVTARTHTLLHFVSGESADPLKTKKSSAAILEVILPEECDKAMQRDGIEPKAQQGFGAKAWWLIQMLEIVPLDHWTAQWQLTPEELLTVSGQGEWAREFFEAWLCAAIRQQNPHWTGALLGAAFESNRVDKFDGLLSAMPMPTKEARLTHLLTNCAPKSRTMLANLVGQCRHDWSAEFSRAVLSFMRRESGQETGDWQLRNQFKNFATFISPAILGEAPSGWPTESKSWEFWSKGVDEFLAAAQFRADVHTAFKTEP